MYLRTSNYASGRKDSDPTLSFLTKKAGCLRKTSRIDVLTLVKQTTDTEVWRDGVGLDVNVSVAKIKQRAF